MPFSAQETLQSQAASSCLAPASRRWGECADARHLAPPSLFVSASCAEQKYDEKCAGGMRRPCEPGLIFTFSAFCRVVVLEKQPFRNTFGLLADGRGQVERERERERESAYAGR